MTPLKKLAAILASQTDLSGPAGDKEVIYYGLQFLFYNLLNLAAIVILAWLIGIFDYTLFAYIASYSLRVFTGGRHTRAPLPCFILSVGSIILIGYSAASLGKVLPLGFLQIFSILIALLSLYSTIKFAPVLVPSKTFTRKRKRLQKTGAIVVWSLWCMVLTLDFTGLLNLKQGIILSILLGMLVQVLSLLPLSTKPLKSI